MLWHHWSCLKEFKRQTWSFSEESGPLRHVLWFCSRTFQELFTLNQISSSHTVWTNSILKENYFNCKRCFETVAEDTIQDFLIELDMKPHLHLVEISILSLNNVTVRLTKIKLWTTSSNISKFWFSKLFFSVENW